MQKKITKSTINSFIRKNRDCVLVKTLSQFDGMVDCVMPQESDFTKMQFILDSEGKEHPSVRSARLYSGSVYTSYENNGMVGYEIDDSCGTYIIAIKSLEVVNA